MQSVSLAGNNPSCEIVFICLLVAGGYAGLKPNILHLYGTSKLVP